MLTDVCPATPRPQPPSRVRRLASTSGKKDFPPPPYRDRPRVDSLLGSPVTMTAHMVEYFSAISAGSPRDSPEPEEWVNEKSREELRELLVKADQTIRERESELGWTSAVCKNLLEDNIVLKNKRESLRSLLPTSPGFSPLPSPFSQVDDLPGSSSVHDTGSPDFTSRLRSKLSPPFRHSRRISVTHSDIALLADQNAELLQKLENLESDSTQADLAGKRRLRKLEKEIQGLRDELERTQARSEELERRASARVELGSDDAWRRREEREERVKTLRKRTTSDATVQDMGTPVRDFAPGGALSNSTSSQPALVHRHTSPDGVLSLSPAPTLNLSTRPDRSSTDPSSAFRFPALAPVDEPEELSPPTEHEFVVVSHLLDKIQELEEINTEIAERQKTTAERLRSAQRDSDSIKRLYDCLGEDGDVEVQIIVEGDDENMDAGDVQLAGPSPVREKTIRFKSLRRTIEGSPAKLAVKETDPDGFFAEGITPQMQSTMNHMFKAHGPAKARKTVVGLFAEADLPFPGTRSNADASSSQLSDLSFAGSSQHYGADDTLNSPPASPTIAPPSLGTALPMPWRTLGVPRAATHTLGSELGSELGDGEVWGAHGENHHLRASSLYGFSQFQADLSLSGTVRSPSPSPLASPTRVHAPLLPDSAPVLKFLAGVEDDGDGRGSATPPRPVFFPRFAPLRAGQADTPPATDTDGTAMSLAPPLSPVPPQSLRSRRLTQAVQARSGRWEQTRFGLDLSLNLKPKFGMDGAARRRASGASSSSSTAHSTSMEGATPTPTSATFRIMSAFDAVVDTLTGRGRSESGSATPDLADRALSSPADEDEATDAGGANETALSVRPLPGAIAETGEKKGVVEVVMELYLWIQFALIVIVFLWAMARRGPKQVLADAGRRRARTASRGRL